MYDYLSILIFLAVAGGFAVIFSRAAYVVAVRRSVRRHQVMNVVSTHLTMRSRFDVRFYLVALLFLVMDLEILFCFPCIALPDIGLWLLEWNCFYSFINSWFYL
jgi:NADH:ubiquinone oxidoreductase subunit 3 (subunit A)